jgi:hypothetical protein
LQNGGGDIGAASDGLDEDHVRRIGAEPFRGVHELGEAAAEASAGYLIGADAVGLGEVRVHQVGALVVQDGRRPQVSGVEQTRRRENQGRLAGAQESAQRNDAGPMLAAYGPVVVAHIVRLNSGC